MQPCSKTRPSGQSNHDVRLDCWCFPARGEQEGAHRAPVDAGSSVLAPCLPYALAAVWVVENLKLVHSHGLGRGVGDWSACTEFL